MLRLLLATVVVASSFTFGGSAYAACGPNALGTHRTVSLNPSKTRFVNGRSGGLALRNKEVVLTFDDGPKAKTTGRILKTLSAHCAKATFFSVGRMARAFPATARKIVRKGHTLAHHTHAHENLPKYSSREIQNRIDKGIRSVQKSVYNVSDNSARVPFFRYPYLARSSRTDAILRKKGLIAFGTNIDSLDWKKVSPATIVNRVMSELKREKKGIILMHDIHNRTVKALPMLLARLNREGYKLVHVVPSRGGTQTVSLSDDRPAKSSKKSAKKKSRLASKPSSNSKKSASKKRNPVVGKKSPLAKARQRFENARDKFKKKWNIGKGRKVSSLGVDESITTASISPEKQRAEAPKIELREAVETNGFVEIAGSKHANSNGIDFSHTASVKKTDIKPRIEAADGIVCVSGC